MNLTAAALCASLCTYVISIFYLSASVWHIFPLIASPFAFSLFIPDEAEGVVFTGRAGWCDAGALIKN